MGIKIMLADDHILVRKGIRQLLEADRNMEVICEADNGAECIEKLKNLKNKFVKMDLLLLDVDMPGKNGIEVLREIKNANLNIKVLILTGHSERKYFSEAVELGVDGYLLKNTEPSTLIKAIGIILDGGTYIPVEQMNASYNAPYGQQDAGNVRRFSLTKRESEILVQVAGGMLNKEIADSLHISERTVKNHLSSLFKKIDVCDRTQAAVFAIRNGIVKL